MPLQTSTSKRFCDICNTFIIELTHRSDALTLTVTGRGDGWNGSLETGNFRLKEKFDMSWLRDYGNGWGVLIQPVFVAAGGISQGESDALREKSAALQKQAAEESFEDAKNQFLATRAEKAAGVLQQVSGAMV
jgi:hypothetical protein